uniref:Interleukin-6 n=1 Tax=Seriola dumerili TaxID=41447 RepID=A0A3B4TVE0_SERDU
MVDACLVSAVMLAALLLCGLGAPVEIEPTNSPAGETSGEEEGMPTAPLSGSQVWDLIINQLEEDGFQVTESSLVKYKISSLPAKCPSSNKEVCLRWVAEGLETYMVLLKHVEKEYPNSSSLSEVGNNSQGLISQIKEEMGKPGKVKVLTSLQEEQLLQHINNPDVFHRRMTTLSILQQLRQFLCDNRRKIRQRNLTKIIPSYKIIRFFVLPLSPQY